MLPVGVVGDDEPGRLLLKAFRHKHVPVSGVLKDKSYTTVTKTRILAGLTHSARQQVVRVDREPEAEPNLHLKRELVLAAREYARASDVLLVSDYGYGAATPAILNAVRDKGRAARRAGGARFALSHAAIFRRDRGHAERTRSRRGAGSADRPRLANALCRGGADHGAR